MKARTVADNVWAAGHKTYFSVGAISDFGEVPETGVVVLGLHGLMGEAIPAIAMERKKAAFIFAALAKKYA